MKRWLIGCLWVLLLIPMQAGAEAVPVTSTMLIEQAKELDGQTVGYSGEVIGDVFLRGDHAWLNIADEANAMGVWVSKDMLNGLASPGRYGQAGDTVQIIGTFHRACQAHGGDMDIHAQQLTIVRSGYPTPVAVNGWMLVAAVLFTVLDIAIFLTYWRKRGTATKHI